MKETEKISKKDIIKTVRDFIIENFLFGDLTNMIMEDDSFMDNGIIDSTGILELIVFIEETFKIEIPENELNPENLDSLNNISAYILSKNENFKCDQSSLQASESALP